MYECIYQLLKICLMLVYFDQYGLLMAGDVFKKNISAPKTVIILGDLNLCGGGYRPRLKRLVRTWSGGEKLVQRHGLKLFLLSFMTIQNYSVHTENRPSGSINYPS